MKRMADYCKQCSMEHFGQDFDDLAGITSPEEEAKGRYAVVICEGCGSIQVDPSGTCISHPHTEIRTYGR